VVYQYSPESFTGTELDYSLEICEAVMEVWEPAKRGKIILNLPATVEMSTPNIYADMIEWFCTNMKERKTPLYLSTPTTIGAPE
jgi:2-isopropylmalate synthase